MKSRMRRWRPALLVALALGAVAGAAYFSFGRPAPHGGPSGPPPERAFSPAEIADYCSRCHAYPPPDSFPRSSWREEVEKAYKLAAESNLHIKALDVTPPPMEQVVRYYEERAPLEFPPPRIRRAAGPPPVEFGRTRYKTPPQAREPAVSNVNLVHLFDECRLDVLACDMRAGLVMALRPYAPSPAWEVLARVPHPCHTEVIDLDGDGIKDVLVANLGSMEPADHYDGSVVWLRGGRDGRFTPVTLLKDVGRVADVRAGDFRGVGKLDLVVAEFGWFRTGRVLYLENHTTDWSRPEFVPRELDPRHGAIHVPVVDLDGDGNLDFVALISQEHETIVAFLGDGKGNFRKETIYTAPHPAWGSSGIQVVDLDGDGELDVLYTNGDTMDPPYLLKPYHGIQWLRNRGTFPFEPHPITPMYGVHRAVAADFRGTGRPDVVAVSYLPPDRFPRRKELGLDSVIYLEQTAPGEFARHTLEGVTCDHVTCAAGDVFGTGKVDLVTGNFVYRPADHAITLWGNRGPSRARAPGVRAGRTPRPRTP